MDPVRQAMAAREAGDYATALRMLLGIADDLRRQGSPQSALPALPFLVLLEWTLLVDKHAPARTALAAHRDEHLQWLMDGDRDCASATWGNLPAPRFWVIAELDDALGEFRSTYEAFRYLLRELPDMADRWASRALPAIVAQGDYTLGERYLPQPLAQLGELNATAQWSPLLPEDSRPPHLAMLLSQYTGDLRLCSAILHGLGRHAEASALRVTGVAGIESESLRSLAERELAVPDTIGGLLGAHLAGLPPPAE